MTKADKLKQYTEKLEVIKGMIQELENVLLQDTRNEIEEQRMKIPELHGFESRYGK